MFASAAPERKKNQKKKTHTQRIKQNQSPSISAVTGTHFQLIQNIGKKFPNISNRQMFTILFYSRFSTNREQKPADISAMVSKLQDELGNFKINYS